MLRRWVRYSLLVAAIGLALLGVLAWHSWYTSRSTIIASAHLGEARSLRYFNSPIHQADQRQVAIYVLDGERARLGLATAVQARLLSVLTGTDVPLVVAVDSNGQREKDFRNASSRPAPWRPSISGRAAAFDRFLLDEVRPLVRERFSGIEKEYVFGHSLAGLYLVDLASRIGSSDGFTGYAAFSPTFSHDLGMIERLARICETKSALFVTIGLESRREDELFERARARSTCAGSLVKFERHPGAIHQIVMLTGQFSALQHIMEGSELSSNTSPGAGAGI